MSCYDPCAVGCFLHYYHHESRGTGSFRNQELRPRIVAGVALRRFLKCVRHIVDVDLGMLLANMVPPFVFQNNPSAA